jgi:hypothetical protein
MGSQIEALWRTVTLFRRYQPQSVTLLSVWRWLKQFPSGLRWDLLALLANVIFISEGQTGAYLEQGNAEVLSRLNADSLGPKNIIYVALDSVGSSSGVMLNILRDRQNLERKGSKFIHTRDGDLMTRYSDELGRGAIVYVDDFAGSGRQFLRNRAIIAPFITGNFAEFIIAACICEEAVTAIESAGVVPLSGLVHQKSERPLHSECSILQPEIKKQFVALCEQIHPSAGLGFKRMATMVVLERNAPNTTPLLFRGNLHQDPMKGIFPRWDDLPF